MHYGLSPLRRLRRAFLAVAFLESKAACAAVTRCCDVHEENGTSSARRYDIVYKQCLDKYDWAPDRRSRAEVAPISSWRKLTAVV